MLKTVSKIYIVVHLATTLIFKRKEIKKNPKKVLKNLIKKICKSVFLVLLYGFWTKCSLCYVPKITYKINTFTALCYCLTGGSMIALESPSRTKMLSMVLFSRLLQSVAPFLNKRQRNPKIPKIEVKPFIVNLSLVHYFRLGLGYHFAYLSLGH
jgi:hypothetical protein